MSLAADFRCYAAKFRKVTSEKWHEIQAWNSGAITELQRRVEVSLEFFADLLWLVFVQKVA
jgi:hypothetical protein